MKKLLFAMMGAALLLVPGGQARAQGEPDIVAVAFTGENYTGVSWAIPALGDYDLWNGFNLPNDSISSIRVRPGYMVTIFQHSEFGGESMNIMADLYEMRENNDWASSMKVELNPNEEADNSPAWAESAIKVGAFQEAGEGGQTPEAVRDFKNMYEPHWYGQTTDDERIQMGMLLLATFVELGYDIGDWQAPTFAQQMNNFFDWRKDKNVWEIACMILNVEYTE